MIFSESTGSAVMAEPAFCLGGYERAGSFYAYFGLCGKSFE
jgi:hypothetical protein